MRERGRGRGRGNGKEGKENERERRETEIKDVRYSRKREYLRSEVIKRDQKHPKKHKRVCPMQT